MHHLTGFKPDLKQSSSKLFLAGLASRRPIDVHLQMPALAEITRTQQGFTIHTKKGSSPDLVG